MWLNVFVKVLRIKNEDIVLFELNVGLGWLYFSLCQKLFNFNINGSIIYF